MFAPSCGYLVFTAFGFAFGRGTSRKGSREREAASCGLWLFQRLDAVDDLGDLLRDLGLAEAVVLQVQRPDHLAGDLGLRLHRDPTRDLLADRRAEESLQRAM